MTSEQYLALGFENQLQAVLDAFPKDLRHERVTTSQDLQRVLGEHPVDIVHIAAYVCPRLGTLYFSPVELPRGRAVPGEIDTMPAEALAELLEGAGVRLVVIASGDSLALATTLLPVTNVISPRDIVSAANMAVWVRAFYSMLKVTSVQQACEYAGKKSLVSMNLLAQQIAPPPITVRVGDPDPPEPADPASASPM